MNTCPNCHEPMEGEFCSRCGIRFDAEPKICPTCKIKFYSKACPNCGFCVTGYLSEYDSATPEKKEKLLYKVFFKTLFITVAVVIIAIILGFMAAKLT